jgi:hypothetical protein
LKRPLYFAIISLIYLNFTWIPVDSFAFGVGDKAPLFNGDSTQGHDQLMSYLGKRNVVLALFFAAFPPV